MGILKNDVGRPSNKTIKIRTILKGILLIVVIAGVFVSGYLLNDYQKKEDNKKETTTKKTTTTKNNSKTYSTEEAFDKFVKDNHLITYTDDEKHSDDDTAVFDINALKSINCLTATRAISDGSVDVFSVEKFTFSDEESAKKEYAEQINYQKTSGEGFVEVYERKILDNKSTNEYDVFEIKYVTDDLENSDFKSYSYYYGVRIKNYYIVLFASNDKDMSEDMIKLKNELNLLLNIK